MKNLVATQSIDIQAPKSKVWNGLTNPDLIKKYFFGTETTTDWKVGSPIFFRGEWNGKAYEDKGAILEVEKDKLIKYSYWSSVSGTEDAPENYHNITYTLIESGDKTTFCVTQDGVKDEQAKKHSEENWGMIMQGLKKLLEED